MPSSKPAPVKPTIPFELFSQIDIRVGTIEHVEDIPKSEKLLRLFVNFGDHKRKIVAGMKKERENPRRLRAGRRFLSSTSSPKR